MNRINQEYIESYINSLKTYKNNKIMNEVAKYAEKEHLPILRGSTASLLDIVVKLLKPNNILELGTSTGYSTMVMARAYDKSKITTIELDEGVLNSAKVFFNRAGIEERIIPFNGDAKEILEYMDGKFDLIFMDGPKAQYINYFDNCFRLLRYGGILFCDDVLFYGMVADNSLINRRKITIVKRLRKFIDMLTTHEELNTIVLPLGDGVSISMKRRKTIEET